MVFLQASRAHSQPSICGVFIQTHAALLLLIHFCVKLTFVVRTLLTHLPSQIFSHEFMSIFYDSVTLDSQRNAKKTSLFHKINTHYALYSQMHSIFFITVYVQNTLCQINFIPLLGKARPDTVSTLWLDIIPSLEHISPLSNSKSNLLKKMFIDIRSNLNLTINKAFFFSHFCYYSGT